MCPPSIAPKKNSFSQHVRSSFSLSDSLLATLLDAVRSCGNQDVHVRVTRTPRGKRVVPLSHSVDEETEANLLKLVIHNFQYPVKRFEIMERFNANIPHTGLNYSVTQDVSELSEVRTGGPFV